MPLKLGLTNPERLDGATREEFEHLIAAIQGTLSQQSDLVNELSSSIGSGTLANIPTGLNSGDAGFRYRITDYGHEVVWSGSRWDFAPGDDGNGYFQDFAITPQQNGWALCDGSVTDYLLMGSTIVATSITLPSASGYYRKSAGAYNATLVAGSMSGETDDVGDSGGSGQMDIFGAGVTAGVDFTAVYTSSTFIHRHGAGTLNPDPPHFEVLTYFRR